MLRYLLIHTMSRNAFFAFLLFIGVNGILYLNLLINHDKIPFNTLIYTKSSHHFFTDERGEGGAFQFLRAMGQMDSQWYLKIGATGYPKNPTVTAMEDKSVMDGLTFAFFPLYPLILAMVNILFHNIELSAFMLANVLMGAIFLSLYYIFNKLYTSTLAFKTIFLIFLFPFGIFFRSYYSEGLFLLLLVWFTYFIVKKQWISASLSASLLYVTRPTGLFLFPLLLLLMANEIRLKRIASLKSLTLTVFSLVPFSGWLIFNYLMTGSPTYWMSVQSSWFITPSIFDTLRYNLTIMAHFFQLPIHDIYLSRIDTAIFIYAGFLVYTSRKYLSRKLWWIGFILWLFPLLTHNTMSYSRYQSVNFPLFIFAASQLRGVWYATISLILFVLLLITSLFFVNWHWVG